MSAGFILVPLSNILAVFSMVPGGLGVKEFVMGLLGGGLGIDFTLVVSRQPLIG